MEWDYVEGTSLAMTPVSQEVVANLHRLSCTEFTLVAFQETWQEFGRKYIYTPRDEYGFRVPVNDYMALTVAPEGERVGCAYLTFCYWEECEWEWHETSKAYNAEKQLYDAVFCEAVKVTQLTLGAPWLIGQDQGNRAHKYIVWRGDTRILILQQCEFAAQFGLEINFWIEPVKAEAFQPHSPLLDWLEKRHQPHEQAS